MNIVDTRRNFVASMLSAIAGILLILSGTNGTFGFYNTILQELQSFISDALILSIAHTIALVLVTISTFGGFLVILGGILIFGNHISLGKLAIGFGAGAGIPWLLFALFTILSTGGISAILAQHNLLGWTGFILSFIARFLAKGNKVSEVVPSTPINAGSSLAHASST